MAAELGTMRVTEQIDAQRNGNNMAPSRPGRG
jgi:hypothetical protein